MNNRKKWDIKDPSSENPDVINDIAQKLSVSRVMAVLLYNRGLYDAESALKFMRKETEFFYDPFMLTDIDKAVERIKRACSAHEKIVVYGDYDVDGVTSVSTLYLYLKEKGADADYYIPNRTGEGYGINHAAVDKLAKSNINLIITVDTGITAYDETEYIKSLGIDIIIIDHHECYADIPKATAVVNPKRSDCGYPFKDLAGVGVVFKLICALEKTYNVNNYLRDICYKYGDLIAIGTIADVMPLIDENRLIVSLGLKLIENTKRPGLIALLEQSGAFPDPKSLRNNKKKKITSSLVGYVIAPRINAAGRISNASKAVELFLTESEFEANKIAGELCETNRERQNEENNIIEQAYKKIAGEHNFDEDFIIVLDNDNWHHGVIGIVSSRITEHYNLPSILISFEEDNNGDCRLGKGSGRSVKGINLVEALTYCSDCLIKYGGHELAAGLTIEREKLPEFKRKINEYARNQIKKEDLITCINVDCELQMNEINLDLVNELYCLEPHGISNPIPVFVLHDVKLVEITPIGNNRHIKFVVEKDNKRLTSVYFGISINEFNYMLGDTVDIIFNLDINDFQNYQSVQLIIRDIKQNREYYKNLDEKRKDYQEIKEGRKILKNECAVPTRDDFVNIYLYLKQEIRGDHDIISIHNIERYLGGNNNDNYLKIKFIIDILNETNIISAEMIKEDIYKFKLNYVNNKVNLDKSSIYKKLKSKQEKS
ncbi:MAG: single-stranded-DNA-specific exonuclease RecJ [Oscillospiraceae bacterium]|nr:single-stranded-DNA-specific exonuclease RecJ [Oscillospiraceae bacterium]